MREIYDEPNKISFLQVKIVDNYDVNLAKDNLLIALENSLGKDTVNIQTYAQLLEQFTNVLNVIKYTLGGIALVSLIVGALGIINTMYVIVTEHTRDIGIMKAVGARNSDILMIYVMQAGIFGAIGSVIGIILGSVFSKLFELWATSYGYSFLAITIDPFIVIGLLFFGFVIGLISGFLPAYRASKIQIIDSMRKG